VTPSDEMRAGQSLPVLHQQIDRLLGVSKLEHAESVLQQAFRAAPANADNHYYAARIAFEREQYAKAAEELERVLGQQPQHSPALHLFVRVAIEQKRFAEAEQVIIGLIRENPEDGELFAQYAWVMLLTLNMDKARALVAEALRLAPNGNMSQTVNLLVALVDGRSERAAHQLQELVRNDPKALHVSWLLVTVLAEQRRYSQALPIAQEILRATPRDKAAVDAVIDLKARASWFSTLYWPVTRFGWGGSIVTWMVAVAGLQVLGRVNPSVAGTVGMVWLVYVLGSWVYMPLLIKWYRFRGL
jgi:tetratricopeptide (TPR) repeat protein